MLYAWLTHSIPRGQALKFCRQQPFLPCVSTISSSALSGLARAQAMMQAAATNTARMSIEDAKAVRAVGTSIEQTDRPIDLASDTVSLSTAKIQFKAALKVIQASEEINKSLLDILG